MKIIAFALAAVTVVIAADTKPLLSKIATYEYGHSREPLVQFTQIVEKSLGSPGTLKQIEADLLRFLQSGATAAGKDFAFRQLSLIATEASISLLTGMLTQRETAEMGRYALTRIPGPAADEALRKALPKASGSIRIGVINSLGQRRDSKSVPVLQPLLLSKESGVAEATASALAEIGGESALHALSVVRTKATGPSRGRITDAYLHCAARADKSAAVKVYKELVAAEEPTSIRIAALGGLTASDPAAAVSVLTAELDSKDPKIQAVAIRLLSGISGSQITGSLVRQFPKLPASSQVTLLAALADRGDASAKPLFVSALKDTGEVRAAALSGLGRLGDSSTVVVLAEAAATSQGVEQAAARSALYTLRGQAIDAAIVSALGSASGRMKVELIMAAGERGIASAADVLTTAVQDKDPDIHREALSALRNVAGPAQIPALLQLLLQASTASDRRESMQALASVLKRSDSAGLDAVISAYKQASTIETRVALLEALGQTSSDEALAVLRNSLKDSTPQVVRAAILALSEWSTPAPLPDLLAIAQNEANPTLQVLALRGYLKLIGLPSQRPAAEGAKMLNQAMQLAKQPAEKRTILSMLTSFPSKESLQLAQAASKDQQVAKEAAAAIEQLNGLLKFQ